MPFGLEGPKLAVPVPTYRPCDDSQGHEALRLPGKDTFSWGTLVLVPGRW